MKTIKVIINFLFTISLLNFLWDFSFKTAAIFNGETGINLSLKDSYSLFLLSTYLLLSMFGVATRLIEVKHIRNLVMHALFFFSMAASFALLTSLYDINTKIESVWLFVNFAIWFTYYSFEQFSSEESENNK